MARDQQTACGVIDVAAVFGVAVALLLIVRVEECVVDVDTNDSIGIKVFQDSGFCLSNGLAAIEGPGETSARGRGTVIGDGDGEVGFAVTVLCRL